MKQQFSDRQIIRNIKEALIKLLISWSGKRDLNPRPPPWQGDALPLSYSRI